MRGDLSLRCKERRNLRGPTMPSTPERRPTTMPGFTTHYILGMKAYNDMPQNNLNSSLQNTAGSTSLVFRDRICFL